MHALAIEIYKVSKGLSPEIMNEAFRLNDNPHNLRYDLHFLCI